MSEKGNSVTLVKATERSGCVISSDGTAKNNKNNVSAHDEAEETELVAPEHRKLAYLALTLATAMCVIDASIVNIALPTIAENLNTSPADSVWVVSSYQIVSAMFLLPLAALGDAIGRRKIYLGGLAIFVAASLVCALAPNLVTLSIARAVQGLGGAAVMSLNVALIRSVFPPKEIGKALGGIMLSVSISAAVAPTLASVILSVASWPFLFLINLPIGLYALWLGYRRLREPKQEPRSYDLQSSVAAAIAIGFLVMGLQQSGESHNNWQIFLLMAVGLAGLLMLIVRQNKLTVPFLPLGMLSSRGLVPIMLASLFAFIGQGAVMVAMPFLLQHELGRSPIATGLLMTPWPVFLGISATVAGRLADRYSMRFLVMTGYSIMAISLLTLLILPNDASDLNIIWRMMLCGIGFGLSQTPSNRALLSSVPMENTGIVGGLNATSRLLGQAVGSASVAIFFAYFMASEGWFTGPRAGLLIGTVGAGLAILFTILTKQSVGRPKPAQNA